jgi:hypothetical protein
LYILIFSSTCIIIAIAPFPFKSITHETLLQTVVWWVLGSLFKAWN